ncbi:MAG: isochorismate synthase [Chloroflexota bacterium]
MTLVPAHPATSEALRARVAPFAGADPIAFFGAARARGGFAFFWSSPRDELTLAAAGTVLALRPTGQDRFEQAARAWRRHADSMRLEGPSVPATGPMLLGGFAFDAVPHDPAWQPLGDALLVLPRALLTATRDGAWLTTTGADAADLTAAGELARDLGCQGRALSVEAACGTWQQVDVPSAREWQQSVRGIVRGLAAGECGLRKLVLARQCQLRGEQPANPVAALRHLTAAYPDTYRFAISLDDSCFLGATPERLAELSAGRVRATSLAGTFRRGATEEEDTALGAALLASPKERQEHRIVTEALVEELTQAGVGLDAVPLEPELLKLGNVQHLCTPLSGAASGISLLELAGRLHPSPAVGGSPREAALQALRRLEPFDRGWYAGPVGWVDRSGDGELTVGIRSCLLRGSEARLYAGCGLVAASNPAAEFEESGLKLRPMLAALGALPE